jgi:hypothetical protein
MGFVRNEHINKGGVVWRCEVWPDWNVRAVVSAIGIASREMDLRFVVAMIAWAIVSLAGVLWVIRPLGAASVTSANEHSIYLLAPFLIGAGALAIIVIRRLKPGVYRSRGDGAVGLGEVDVDGVSMADRLAYWSAVIVIDPKEFPRIEEMPVYWWHAQINRGTLGEGRAINKASTVLTKKSETAAPPGKKGTGKVKSKSLLEMDDDELDHALGSPAGADGEK